MTTLREPAEILAAMDAAYADLRAILDGLTPAQKTAPGATGDWRVQDVLAHLARWNDVAYDQLVTLARGERPAHDYSNYLELNDQWTSEDVGRTLDEVAEHFETSHGRIAGLLRGLATEQWTRSVRRWAWIAVPEHYAEHVGYLRAWLAG